MNSNSLTSHLPAIQSALMNLPSVSLMHIDSAAGSAALETAMQSVYGLLPPVITGNRIASAVYAGLERVAMHYYMMRTVNSGANM